MKRYNLYKRAHHAHTSRQRPGVNPRPQDADPPSPSLRQSTLAAPLRLHSQTFRHVCHGRPLRLPTTLGQRRTADRPGRQTRPAGHLPGPARCARRRGALVVEDGPDARPGVVGRAFRTGPAQRRRGEHSTGVSGARADRQTTPHRYQAAHPDTCQGQCSTNLPGSSSYQRCNYSTDNLVAQP